MSEIVVNVLISIRMDQLAALEAEKSKAILDGIAALLAASRQSGHTMRVELLDGNNPQIAP